MSCANSRHPGATGACATPVPDNRRLSPPLAVTRRRSPSIAVDRRRSPSQMFEFCVDPFSLKHPLKKKLGPGAAQPGRSLYIHKLPIVRLWRWLAADLKICAPRLSPRDSVDSKSWFVRPGPPGRGRGPCAYGLASPAFTPTWLRRGGLGLCAAIQFGVSGPGGVRSRESLSPSGPTPRRSAPQAPGVVLVRGLAPKDFPGLVG